MIFKISNFAILPILLGIIAEARQLKKYGESLDSFLNTPSKEAVENTIQETSNLLSKLRDDDEVTHHICLELKYLNFSSIRVSANCILLFEQPDCKGKVSEDKNAVISIGKNKLQSCKTGNNVTPTTERTNNSLMVTVSPTGSSILESSQYHQSSTAANGGKDYDLSDFPDDGEFEPWKPTTRSSGVTSRPELDTGRPASTVLIVNEPRPSDEKSVVTTNGIQSHIPTSHHQGMRDPYPRGPPPDGPPCKRKCEAMDAYGIPWEVCLSGTGFRPCPGDTPSTGNVVWQCGSDGHFIQSPDYSQCHSQWVADAESSIILNPTHRREDNGKVTSGIILHNVNRSTSHARPQYFGHEIPGILTLVDRVTAVGDKNDLNEAESLVSSSMVILNSVASEPETWNQLPQRERAATGTQLIRTVESTMFGLARAGRKFGREKYDKAFTQSPHLRVRVGSLKRSSPEGGELILGQESKDPVIKLPPGWTSLAPPDEQDDEVHFVQMSMTSDCVNNIIPSRSKLGSSEGKRINSKLATFSVSDRTGTRAAKINFTGDGIRIIFPHDAEASGTKGTVEVHRRLHPHERPTLVLGSAVCVYWDTEALDWATEGCQLVESGRMYSTCECNHLTSFAVLMDAHQYVGKDTGLIVITRLLCILSCIFLLATIIIFKRLHSVRNPRSSVTIHLCFCLLLGNLLVLTLMDRDNFPIPNGFCAVVGMATHFVFLSAFAWMGIEGFIVYKMVVDVFESGTDNKIKLRLVAYGVPLVIVLIFLIVHVSTDGSTYGGELYCWLQGNYIWSFIVPVICVCFMNLVVLIIALQTAFNKNNSTVQVKQTSSKQSRNMIIGTMSLSCLLGLTWIFGLLLTIAEPTVAIVGAYFFTIFNASQGIFIFIFHCWMNKQVRNVLMRRVTAWHSTFVSTDNTKMGGPNERRRSEPSFLHADDPTSRTNTTLSTSVGSSNVDEKAVMLAAPSERATTAKNLEEGRSHPPETAC